MDYKACTNYEDGECRSSKEGCFCPIRMYNMCLGELGAHAILKSRDCFTEEPKVNKYAGRLKELENANT